MQHRSMNDAVLEQRVICFVENRSLINSRRNFPFTIEGDILMKIIELPKH